MIDKSRIVLMTGDRFRHHFVATRLAESTNLLGVVSEDKAPAVAEPTSMRAEDLRVVEAHLSDWSATAKRYFGGDLVFPQPCFAIPHGQANSKTVFDWVRRLDPDFLVLFGSSVVHDPLLTAFQSRTVNIHLGLSPYYRGSATNFWPLVYGEPECVGATLHLATAEIDGGPILAQVRPKADPTDGPHDLGCKTIIAAMDLLPDVLAAFSRGEIHPQPQPPRKGRLLRKRDFTADAVRTLHEKMVAGMVPEFVRHCAERTARFPIIEPFRAT